MKSVEDEVGEQMAQQSRCRQVEAVIQSTYCAGGPTQLWRREVNIVLGYQ